MRVYAGTSGFAFKEWKGSFYPADLPATAMLRYYGEQLPAVEINNTFYRMPKESVLVGWAADVPADFRFALKASRRITHFKRLAATEEDVRYLFETAQALGPRLGPVLFQLPPNFKKDTDLLKSFLEALPTGARAAFEFRHPSWFDTDTVTVLNDYGCPLCLSETDDDDETPAILGSATWGYLRLRRTSYSSEDLTAWCRLIAGETWDEVYVFFKHEEAGTGPALARQFRALVEG
jgi:uncharacterized protein YecE (DUF72 family)